MNNNTAPAHTFTEAKIADMIPGQRVTFPTDGNGQHGGPLVRFEARGPVAGPDALTVVYRDSDGEEVAVRTYGTYTGYVLTPTRSAAAIIAEHDKMDRAEAALGAIPAEPLSDDYVTATLAVHGGDAVTLSEGTAAESRWTVTESLHADCADCADSAHAAAVYASVTGSRGGTYAPEHRNADGTLTARHSATVARLPR